MTFLFLFCFFFLSRACFLLHKQYCLRKNHKLQTRRLTKPARTTQGNGHTGKHRDQERNTRSPSGTRVRSASAASTFSCAPYPDGPAARVVTEGSVTPALLDWRVIEAADDAIAQSDTPSRQPSHETGGGAVPLRTKLPSVTVQGSV